MNTALNPFLTVLLLSAVWMIVCMARIYDYLRRRGEKVSFLWLRWRFFDYLNRYRRITTAEYGRPGTLYYQFIASAALALLCALTFVLVLLSRR